MQTRFRFIAMPFAAALLITGGVRDGLAAAPASKAGLQANGKGDVRRAEGAQSLDAIVAQVEKRYRARVVRVETRQHKGRTIYELRLLNAEGKVWTVQVDADSGAVL